MNRSLHPLTKTLLILALLGACVRTTFGGDNNSSAALVFTPAFYRAVNINGAAITVDGNSFVASSGAANFSVSQTGGGSFANQSVTLVPSTDANRATMIRSSVYGTAVNVTMSSVPNGYYDIYLYVWEDSNPQTYSVSVEGSVVQSNYNSGSAGAWAKLGPYRTNITDGTINITSSGGHANFSGVEVWTANNPPVISNAIPDHTAIVNDNFIYTVPSNTFSDPDAGTTLTYSASLSDGNPLPSWLSFNASTRKFTGTPGSGNTGTINVRVTVSDDELTASDIFALNVTTAFYRALNLNGAAITIDGNSWEASSGASNFSYTQSGGGTFANQSITLVPSTDANRATMIRSSIYGNPVNLNVTSVPNGTYDVSIYVLEDNFPETYSVSLEGSVVLANYNSGSAGVWKKLGPFRKLITDGAINVSASGGTANIGGIEILRGSTGEVPVTEVTVSPTTMTLAIGEANKLTSSVLPANATTSTLTWISGNTSVATVDANGLVRAVAAGTAVITATSTDGGFTGTSTVTVVSAGSNVLLNPEFDLALNNWIVYDFAGTPLNQTSVVQGAGLSGNNSMFTDIANGTSNGWGYQIRNILPFRLEVGRTYRISYMAKAQSARTMTALLSGLSTTYWSTSSSVTTSVQKFTYQYTCTQAGVANEPNFFFQFHLANGTVSDIWLDNVRVEDITGITAVTGLALSPSPLALVVGQTGQITKTFTPSNATNQEVTWSSANTGIATVDNTGLVTAVSVGSTVVSAYTTSGGYTATTPVNVTSVPVTGITVAPTSVTLTTGQTAQVTQTITPSNATNQTVNWTSGNTAVATVNSSGLVTAVAPGEATITATTVSGGFTANTVVTVVIPVTGVSVAPAALTLTAGQTAQLTETVSPSNATNRTVTWSSSNTSVATVDNTGLVTALSLAGSATITATTTDGAFTAQTAITVEEVASTATILAKFAFQYKYDGRKRMTHKKVPGADSVFMVYDDRDRLVMTQDGNQRAKSTPEWTFTKYDVLNRPILTGIYLDAENKDQDGMQTKVNDFYIAAENNSDEWFEVTGGTVHGYTNQSFPNVSSEGQYLTVSYYDDYSFISLIGTGASDYQYDDSRLTASGNDEGQEEEAFDRVQGQVTGSRIKNLGTNEWMWSVTYYDDRYRTIQVIAQNSKGGLDKITNVYDFAGQVLRTKTDHTVSGATAIATTRKLTYDHAGRLLQTEHHTNNKEVVLTKNEYNELGQLVTKKLHSEDNAQSFKQHVDYRYNIRGWLSRINNSDLGEVDGGPKDYFGMELGYNTDIGVGASSLQYNGNISAIKYSTNQGLGINIDSEDPILEATERGYAFEYDPMNRLTEAAHRERTLAWNPTTAFREGALQYDLNGNILHLDRKGKSGDDMDELAYTYSGNRLMQVTDAENALEGFKDGNVSGDDYLYDANGNMITDRNKNIETITYNHLNLPAIVTKTTGEHVNYIYNAAGVKMSQEVYDAANTLTKKTDYLGEFFYEDDILQFINHEEGRVVMTGADPEYQYTLKDHLGNSRITFTSKEETEAPVATLETENETEERANFLKYDDVRLVNSTFFDHTDTESTQYALRLTGTPAETYGLARSISVMPGDKITAEVFAKYVDLSQTDVTTALRDFITLVATGAASSGTVIDGGAYGSPGASTLPFGALLDKSDETGDAPKAYLNYLVFDKDYELIISKSGYQRVSVAASENGQLLTPDGKLHERLQSPEIEISQPGYVYIYLSNEEGGKEVYFDDFKVEHVKSPVIQQDDYYPFGLTFNSYQRENSVGQDYLYQSKERQSELDLNTYDFHARMYDPALGRTFQMDPHADSYLNLSPYSWVGNNPLLLVDPTGMDIEQSTKKFYKDKDGNEHEKAKISFRRTSRIERTIKVSNVKILNGAGENKSTGRNPTKSELAEAGKHTKEEVIDSWTRKETNRKGVEVSVNVEWEDNVEVINDRSELKAGDVLINIGEPTRAGALGEARPGNEMLINSDRSNLDAVMQRNDGWDSSPGVFSYSEGRIASHEFGHMGGLVGHTPRSIMQSPDSGGRPPTFRQLKNIFRGRRNISR